jgi:hypothetical protein
LIIAGVRKAGTTSLFHYLSQHPEICPCQIKEPSYFLPLKYSKELSPMSDYLRLFAHCRDEAYLMEASPGYFSGGAMIAYPLARTLRRPHVAVILRNPRDTFASNFNFLRSRLRLPKATSMDEYLDQCERLHRQGADASWENRDYHSIYVGMYYRFLPAWLDALGDRFKIIFFEDLAADPRAVVKDLCAWLGIPVEPADAFDYSVENKTEQYRIRCLQQIALFGNRRFKQFFRRFHFVKKSLRQVYYLVNGDPRGNRSLSAHGQARLEAIFAEPNRRLARQLLAAGYERLPPWVGAPAEVSRC